MTTSKPEVRPDQPRITKHYAYDDFIAKEGIPNITGFAVDDLRSVEVKPWARLDCLGTYINLDGAGKTNDAYVAEIPPGGKMAPEKHIFEEEIYVLSGRGATLVGDDPHSRTSFEWKAGSIFAVPINVWHQHLNGSGSEPARFVAVTTAPITMNLFHNEGFVFNNPYVFEDRMGSNKLYQGEGKMWTATTGRTNAWETNFVPDVENFTVFTWKERGAGGAHIKFEMAEQVQTAHISEFPVGTYKKAHKHGPGAHVIILKGEGYSLLWPSHGSPRDGMERVDWKPGSMVVPPNGWFHQHFNGGATPARYLAFRWNSQKYGFSLGVAMEGETDVDVNLGGGQIEYENEDPLIHDIFVETISKHGAESQMAEFIPRLRK
jgi:quercetin dioxygenase-like cupin family protein